ncbi:MAG: DUF2330 domain-containing protein, partial [Myxococcales bacterium]|nr:DUF2330 domain-containing protein [Myxococcales bacterium]
MKGLRRALGLAAIALLWSGNAFGLGAVVTGDDTVVTASRTLVIRSADAVQIVTQIRYRGTPDPLVWLLAIPNFNAPRDAGVVATLFPQGGLDELDTLTRPRLSGACEGMPTGMTQEILLADQFGPAPAMLPPVSFFPAREILAGDLDDYLDGLGLTLDDATRAAVTGVVDQNFMIAAVRISPADIGFNRVDPLVALRYPLDAGDPVRLALRPIAASVDGPANLLLWVLDDQRMRVDTFRTEELDYAGVQFISPSETNYVQALDMQVGVRQTQMFVVEQAGPIAAGDINDNALGEAVANSGAGFLTRLRARPVAAAIANNLAIITLTPVGAAPVSREHMVTGFNCGGPMPDPDMDVPDPADMGPDAEVDAAPIEPELDMGQEPTADAGSGGGGGGGACSAAPGL